MLSESQSPNGKVRNIGVVWWLGILVGTFRYQNYDIVSKAHSDIVQYFQIYPNIVRHWLILSKSDQYYPPCIDIFPFKLNLRHFKSDIDAV